MTKITKIGGQIFLNFEIKRLKIVIKHFKCIKKEMAQIVYFMVLCTLSPVRGSIDV